MTGLRELSSLAKRIDSGELSDGAWLELEIESLAQLKEVVAKAHENNVYVLRGKGKTSAAKLKALICANSQNKPVSAVSLNFSRLNKIVEHVREDQVISVETGIGVGELNKHLSNHGQWLPVSEHAFNNNTTLADVIDCGDVGFLETFSGTKQLVLGMQLVISDGDVIKTGGKIVKNVTGYDLSKLFVGSHSWLAIPHMVHLRLFGKPEEQKCFLAGARKPQDAIAIAVKLRASGLPLHYLEVFDTSLVSLSKLSDCTAAVLVGTQEHKKVAGEVIKAMRTIVESAGFPVENMDGNEFIDLRKTLSRCTVSGADDWIELSMSASALTYFFDSWWHQHEKPRWTARPATGRLRLEFPHSDFGTLEQFARLVNHDGWQPLTVAYQTPVSDFTVRRLSTEQESEESTGRIMHRLKDKYDPKGIFNPLVSFYPGEA